jgi:hypothetical protein
MGYRYGFLDGTSMTLLWSAKTDATEDEITKAIQKTAEDLGKGGKDRYYGHGFVLALDALEHLLRVPIKKNIGISGKSGKKNSSSGHGKHHSSSATK